MIFKKLVLYVICLSIINNNFILCLEIENQEEPEIQNNKDYFSLNNTLKNIVLKQFYLNLNKKQQKKFETLHITLNDYFNNSLNNILELTQKHGNILERYKRHKKINALNFAIEFSLSAHIDNYVSYKFSINDLKKESLYSTLTTQEKIHLTKAFIDIKVICDQYMSEILDILKDYKDIKESLNEFIGPNILELKIGLKDFQPLSTYILN